MGAFAQAQRADNAEIRVTAEALERATAQAEVTVQSELRASAEIDRDAQEREARSLDLAKQSAEALTQNNIQDALEYALRAVDVTYAVDGTYTGAAEAALYQALMDTSHPVSRISSRTDLNPVVGVAQFLPDGERFLTSQGYQAGLWNVDGKMLTVLDGVYGSDLRQAAIATDGSVFVTVELLDDQVFVWDANGRLQHIICTNPDGTCGSFSAGSDAEKLAINSDGTHMVTIHNGTVQGEEQGGVARVWTIDGELIAELSGHTDTILAVEFSPDGSQLLTSGQDGTARLWQLDGTFLHQFDHVSTMGVLYINGAHFSEDGRYIITVSKDHNTAVIWNRDGTLYQELSHNAPVSLATISPDNHHI
ncbi:MAG: hypothetical protein KC496_16630, partial [Anaerolineae bacterium]|nr:hypothetical protein [Anaerolineae bacterium]